MSSLRQCMSSSMFILLFALLFSSFTSAVPLEVEKRALAIPGAPADPAAPIGDGAGVWNSVPATWTDQLAKIKFQGIATTADTFGLDNAAKNLRHYLGNTGADLYINPDLIVSDVSQFAQAVKTSVRIQAEAALNAIPGAWGEKSFRSNWQNFYAYKDWTWDWFFALGGYSYSVAGVVTKTPSGNTLRYKVHIFDRYNWDTGKSVDIIGIHFEDKELGDLHLKGLAKEYIVRGTSASEKVVNLFKIGGPI